MISGEFDVVVVGAGNAGMCAALAARGEGARVLVLEAAPFDERGGNSRFTAGALRFVYNGVEDLLKICDLSEAELNRARAQVEAGLLMALETPAGRADAMARSIEIFGRIMTLDEMLAEVRSVDVAAARAAGTLALSGPRADASIGESQALAA